MSALNAPPQPVSPNEERSAHEPSMEEILASIRRIIADDDLPPPARRDMNDRRRIDGVQAGDRPQQKFVPREPAAAAKEAADRYRSAAPAAYPDEETRPTFRRDRIDRGRIDEAAPQDRRRPMPETAETTLKPVARETGEATDRCRSLSTTSYVEDEDGPSLRRDRGRGDEVLPEPRRRALAEPAETAQKPALREPAASAESRDPSRSLSGATYADDEDAPSLHRDRSDRSRSDEAQAEERRRAFSETPESQMKSVMIEPPPASSESSDSYRQSASTYAAEEGLILRHDRNERREDDESDAEDRRSALAELQEPSAQSAASEADRQRRPASPAYDDEENAPFDGPQEADYDDPQESDEVDEPQAYASSHDAFVSAENAAPLMSPDAAASISAQFQQLAASMLINDSGLLKEYACEMLRPMLKTWLDDNLPVLVERLVRAEIERVARGGRR